MQKVDFLIVGQGIAGSWLAWYLLQQQQQILIIDEQKKYTSSSLASGIINPIRGKRFTEAKDCNVLLPFAKKQYQLVERFFTSSFLKETTMVKFFTDAEQAHWFQKRIDEKNTFVQKNTIDFSGYFHIPFGAGLVHPCYQIQAVNFLQAIKNYAIAHNSLLQERFDYEQLVITDTDVQYKHIEAKHIIFCDGISASQQHLWEHLQFANTKAECMLVDIPGLDKNYIYKHKHSIVPYNNSVFWVGASNTWDYGHSNPSIEFYNKTKEWLHTFLKMPCTIQEHVSSVRPTLRSREVVFGNHPKHRQIHILNGMGTNGYSLAPYYANKLVQEYLLV